MATVAVLGGSVAGTFAALSLARAGHDVTVYERDPAPPPDAERAFAAWDRPGTPHLRQSHAFLARSVALLRTEHPDLYAALLDAGAHVVRTVDHLPPWIADRAPRPGDDEMLTLSARRAVYDWVMQSYALASGVRVDRTGVEGLTFADGGAVPHVTGLRLASGATFAADVVVDASGRRTRTPKWLADAGTTVNTDGETSCGNCYYTRFYRLHPGATPPPLMRGFANFADLDALSMLLFRGDGDTYSASVQIEQTDEELRGLRDPRAFDAAVAAVPPIAAWTSPDVGRPLNDPVVMAGLSNVVRRLVRDGRPVATGVLLVGDAAATSNPAWGRGVSLGMVSARLTVDAVAHRDPGDQVLALDEGVRREVAPFVDNSRELDQAANARWRNVLYGDPVPPPPEGLTFSDVMVAAMRDRDTHERFMRVVGLFDSPDDLLADPVIRATAAETKASGWQPDLPPMPGRADVVAAMRAAV